MATSNFNKDTHTLPSYPVRKGSRSGARIISDSDLRSVSGRSSQDSGISSPVSPLGDDAVFSAFPQSKAERFSRLKQTKKYEHPTALGLFGLAPVTDDESELLRSRSYSFSDSRFRRQISVPAQTVADRPRREIHYIHSHSIADDITPREWCLRHGMTDDTYRVLWAHGLRTVSLIHTMTETDIQDMAGDIPLDQRKSLRLAIATLTLTKGRKGTVGQGEYASIAEVSNPEVKPFSAPTSSGVIYMKEYKHPKLSKKDRREILKKVKKEFAESF